MLRVAVAAGLAVAALTACSGEPAPSRGTVSTVAASTAAPTAPRSSATSRPAPTPSPSATRGFDLRQHSIDDPGSIWVVVDKRRPLSPKSWVPRDLVQPAVPHTNVPRLRKPAAAALERMVSAARRDGVGVVSLSAYRAYTMQRSIYERNVASMGKAATERLTARPGYSEHQTGLADDLGDASGRCPIAACFATTPAGRWLAANAWRYGWILRYPKGEQAVTGIQWEPWHYRWVGTGLSKHMHATRQTLLERVFDLPSSPDYR